MKRMKDLKKIVTPLCLHDLLLTSLFFLLNFSIIVLRNTDENFCANVASFSVENL